MNGDLILRLSGVKKNRVTNETSIKKKGEHCANRTTKKYTPKRALMEQQNHQEKHTKTRVDGTTEPQDTA